MDQAGQEISRAHSHRNQKPGEPVYGDVCRGQPANIQDNQRQGSGNREGLENAAREWNRIVDGQS